MASHELTCASFFSGVGGDALGLERAGWRHVSFSEIDPYACAVLAQRWPGVPNLGDITAWLAFGTSALDNGRGGPVADPDGEITVSGPAQGRRHRSAATPPSGPAASPARTSASPASAGASASTTSMAFDRCNGMAGRTGRPTLPTGLGEWGLQPRDGGPRGPGLSSTPEPAVPASPSPSSELVGRHRPPIVLLENVPGLLSSHGGRDMAALLGALVDLGYGVGYRVLDARHFGVPQRRRRVFIVGLAAGGRAGAELAAEVLSVGSRCRRHPPTGVEAGEDAAAGAGDGTDVVGTIDANYGRKWGSDQWMDPGKRFLQVQRPAWRRIRCPDCDDWACDLHGGHIGERCDCWPCDACGDLSDELDEHGLCPDCAPPHPHRMRAAPGLAGRLDHRGGVAATLNSGGNDGGFRTEPGAHLVGTQAEATVTDDPLLPPGLDSHRYRCCGNGVAAPVAEWIGHRLAAAL